MLYINHLNRLKKITQNIKRAFKSILKIGGPYQIMTFNDILLKKNLLANPGILNSPEHYNWKMEIKETDISFVKYSTVIADLKSVNFDNTKFSSPYFKNKFRFKSSGIFSPVKKYIYSLEHANILSFYGLVYDANTRSLIKETVYHYYLPAKYNEYLSIFHLPTQTSLKGIGLLLAHPGSDGGFYHFLLESLGKLCLVDSLLENANYICLPGPGTNWKIKWLSLFNIELKKVIWLNYNSNIKVEQLIFTSPIIHDQQPDHAIITYIKDVANNFLNKNLQVNTKVYPKRLWFTRKSKQERDVLWEEQIINYFGLTSIDFSDLDVKETILICKNAELIIGPHGAAFVNVIFCNDETNVIELFPDEGIPPVYSRLCEQLTIKYTGLIINFNDSSVNDSFNRLNAIIADLI